MSELKYDVWIHEKTGNRFSVVSEGKVKINDQWEKSVNYIKISFNLNENNDMVYTRTLEDFLKNFKPKL